MRSLWNDVRKPINTGAKRFAGHLFLRFADDGQIATHLAQSHYDMDLGARSLQRGVNLEIKDKLAQEMLERDAAFEDATNDEPLSKYEIRLETMADGESEVVVEHKSTQAVQHPPKA